MNYYIQKKKNQLRQFSYKLNYFIIMSRSDFVIKYLLSINHYNKRKLINLRINEQSIKKNKKNIHKTK